MPYLAPLERETRGCKIAVEGYCLGQRLSTAIFNFKPYKITVSEGRMKENTSLAFWCKLKNPSFSNPSYPESSSARAAGTEPSLCRLEEEAERRGRGRKKGKKKTGGGRKKTVPSPKIHIFYLFITFIMIEFYN